MYNLSTHLKTECIGCNLKVIRFIQCCEVDCEGLALYIIHRTHMELIDFDPEPILGIGSYRY